VNTGPAFVEDFVYSVEHDLDDDEIARLGHTFLIRDPRRVLQGMAKHRPWHDNLRASSGISKPTTTYPPLEEDQRLLEMYERSVPLFDDLLAHKFNPLPTSD
jgi:hypothetical protein